MSPIRTLGELKAAVAALDADDSMEVHIVSGDYINGPGVAVWDSDGYELARIELDW